MDASCRKCGNFLNGISYNMLFHMVRLSGFEPLTHGLEGQCFPIHGNKRAITATIKTGGYALALFPVDCG